MGFILDGLETEAYDRSYRDRDLLGRILGYFRPHVAGIAIVASAISLSSLAGAAGPILIGRGIDLLRVASGATVTTMLLLALGVLLLGAAGWGFNFVQQWFAVRVVGDVVLQLRKDVFAATMQHDLSFFESYPSGKIVSRVTSDTQDFSDVVALVTTLLSQVLLVVALSVWLANINGWLTLFLLGMTPLAVGIALSFRKIARLVTQRARRVTAKINAQIQESIGGIMVAKTFRREAAIYDAFAANNRQSYQVGLRRGLTLNTIFPILGLSSGLGTAILIYTGGLATLANNPFGVPAISTGNWYLFMQAVGFYWWPLINIASFWSQFQDGLAAAERVFSLIDAKPKVVQEATEPVDCVDGRIEFRHVAFSYTGAEVVLRDFSLAVRPRETLAIVGHTGAGKSSLANLIARFYEFQGGELLVDGRDIRRLDLDQYRRFVGLVPQDPFLFSGTVGENIRQGNPGATDSEVLQAARQIGGGDWLGDLPRGLDSEVGERGGSLSMGQRQLVALARVLLKNPAVFVLDEATASVDPFTEMQIQDGLETIMRERTAIVIAHRLSTVRHADRIIVLKSGEIIGEGTHDQLMAQGGHYAELYNAYFRHQSYEYIESFGRTVAAAA
jgi:ATP-binding cassette, subfamily B, bacterial